MLKAGDIIDRGPQGLWYVECVTHSGAHCIGLSGFETPITTRKRVTKVVRRHKRMQVISAHALVDVLDPATLDMVAIRKRIKMARKKEADVTENTQGQENTEQAARPQPTPRATQSYVRTSKEAKDMRGQGKIVLDAIAKAEGPVNVASLVASIGKFENSRQDPERVVGFYLSKFKREGLVNVVASEQAAEPAAAAAEV